MSDEITVHIDSSEKREELPDIGSATKCSNSNCPAPNFEMGFGLGGGGYGPYEFCPVCGNIVSKTCMEE